jgi:transcriptional regulator with XRE-family HTH domain
VARVLESAAERGLTNAEIAKVTGVGTSTFHRWRRGDYKEAPELARVRAFCEGLGVPVSEAFAALGVSDRRDTPEPEPALDPDIRIVLRALSDPEVSAHDKAVIRQMIKMMADQHRQRRPARREAAS